MRTLLSTLAAAASALLIGAAPGLAQGPPPPTAVLPGSTVETMATGIPTPVAFATFGDRIFIAAAGAEDGSAAGGVYLLGDDAAAPLPGMPSSVFGLAVIGDTMFATSGKKIYALSGWNGTTFSSVKVIYTGGKDLPGFGGIAAGPDGRLYAGTFLDVKYDGKRDPRRYAQAVVSIKPDGTGLRVVSKGLRQPWQLAFAPGAKGPFVSTLAVDRGKIPLDAIVVATPGADFGFPVCDFIARKPCAKFNKPFVTLPKHSSPMGLAVIGDKLYAALFGGLQRGKSEVVSIPLSGGRPTPVLTGFAAPVLSVGAVGETLMVGDVTGAVYRLWFTS